MRDLRWVGISGEPRMAVEKLKRELREDRRAEKRMLMGIFWELKIAKGS